MRQTIASRSLFLGFIFLLSLGVVRPVFADPTSEIILNVLIAKGLITEAEVEDMRIKIEQQQKVQIPKPSVIAEPQNAKKKPMQAYWKDGFNIASPDENFRLNIGARIMNDWGWINENQDQKFSTEPQNNEVVGGNREDNAQVREARISLSGEMYEDYFFRIQTDFTSDADTNDNEGESIDIKDAYFERRNIPYLGTLRAGQFKEPIGLENNTSKRFITFMERSMMTSILLPEREEGVMAYNNFLKDDRGYWAAGIFKDIDDDGSTDSTAQGGDYTVDTRVTVLPWYEDEGRQLIHAGVDFTHKKFNNEEFHFRGNPESSIWDDTLSDPSAADDEEPFYTLYTGTIGDGAGEQDSRHMNRWVLEAATVYGPLSLQGEYTIIDMNTRRFNGYYLYASYFLTGEHREYDKRQAEFERIHPKKNFNLKGEDKGLGAIEVGLRYSTIDLSSRDVDGGGLDTVTVGLNWYLNPNIRLMFNYLWVDGDFINPRREDPQASVLQTRFQLDF